jgi:HSP20 family protein
MKGERVVTDIKVKNQPSEEQTRRQSKGAEHAQPEHGLARRFRGGLFPSLFSPMPRELFGMAPFGLMRRMAEEMDRAFGESGWPFGLEGEEGAGWWPALEVTKDDGMLKVNADLPGLKPEDVKVEVTDDALVIKGERKREHEESGKEFHRSERSFGRFYRCIGLPEGAKTNEARAEFSNGELKVSIPVPQTEPKRREIPIKTK